MIDEKSILVHAAAIATVVKAVDEHHAGNGEVAELLWPCGVDVCKERGLDHSAEQQTVNRAYFDIVQADRVDGGYYFTERTIFAALLTNLVKAVRLGQSHKPGRCPDSETGLIIRDVLRDATIKSTSAVIEGCFDPAGKSFGYSC